MSVYIDNAKLPYRDMVMCHMVADTMDELTNMADRIGISCRWLQNKPGRVPHFDVCLSKRRLAVNAGAIEIERRELAMFLAKWKKDSVTTEKGAN